MTVVKNPVYPANASQPSPTSPPQLCKSLVFLNVRDIRHGAHQYGKDWVPLGLLAASPVSGLWLLFTIHLIHYASLKRHNVSNVL